MLASSSKAALAAPLLSLLLLTSLPSLSAAAHHLDKNDTASPSSSANSPDVSAPAGGGSASKGWTSLPQVVGATVDSTLAVAAGAGLNQPADAGTLPVLVNYRSQGVDTTKVKRAILQVHDVSRDPWDYFNFVNSSLADAAQKNSAIDPTEVFIMCPGFFNQLDHTAFANIPNALAWKDQGWLDGDPAVMPSGSPSPAAARRSLPLSSPLPLPARHLGDTVRGWRGLFSSRAHHGAAAGGGSQPDALAGNNVSSFDALDAGVAFFANKTAFPNLNTIVIAGFSAGAQLVQRYALVGVAPTQAMAQNDKLSVSFFISAAGSYAWLDDKRSLSTSQCSNNFNQWKYGFENYTIAYAQDIVFGGQANSDNGLAAIQQSFVGKVVNYAYGLNDTAPPIDVSCAAQAQGSSHVARGFNFIQSLNGMAGQKGFPSRQTLDWVPGVGHNPQKVIDSDAAHQRYFYDNWNGDGTAAGGVTIFKGGNANTYPTAGNPLDQDPAQAEGADPGTGDVGPSGGKHQGINAASLQVGAPVDLVRWKALAWALAGAMGVAFGM